MPITFREISKKSVRDLWRGIVSCKSRASELKNWMPKYSKNK